MSFNFIVPPSLSKMAAPGIMAILYLEGGMEKEDIPRSPEGLIGSCTHTLLNIAIPKSKGSLEIHALLKIGISDPIQEREHVYRGATIGLCYIA